MKSEYNSNRSIAGIPAIPIAVDDPRLSWDQIALTKATIGGPIDIIGLDGKSITAGGTTFNAPTGAAVVSSKSSGANYSPPSNGQPALDVGFGELTPTDPTNVSAVWSGNDLVVSFYWDSSDSLNQTVSNFILELTVDGIKFKTPLETFVPNKTTSSQVLTLTEILNTKTFNIFTTNITSISVFAIDPFYNTSASVAVASVPTYSFALSAPVITVSSIVSGYSVAYTAPTDASYGSIEIVEYESSSSTEPTGVTYSRVYLGTITPANIIASNTNARWVKARFVGKSGTNFTSFSAAQKVTPTNPVSIDNTPPNEVSSVTGIWSSDDIVISYTLPSTDPAARIQIQLTAPNNLVGYFYRFPSGSGAQTTTITKKDLFDQFGEHYSLFTGLLKSVDAADNKTSGVSFTVAQRANPLTGVTPAFTLVALSNAYSATFILPVGAAFGEVYASHTDWSGNPSEDILVYAGLSPAVITDTDYTTTYVMMRYYDDFGNTSGYSAKQTVTPLDPGLITSFENPISFGENAVIYAGNSPTTGTRTLFKAGGIFAYDATNASPSTQIVSNATAGSPTFITKQAQIADWKVSEYKIENDLSGTPTKYTGLSASGDYSFWAGSSVSGGNSSAKFTVTPLGAVTARELYIVGTGDANSKMIDVGGAFYVKHDGSIYASSADITGKITAASGSFSGNVSIGSSGSIYSGTVSGSNIVGAGFILNQSGLSFSSSSTSGITTINGSTGKLITKSAEIGNWSVDENRIYKVSAGGQGNISLDSANGYIYVSDDTVPTYTAGINSVKLSTDVAFWAGSAKENNLPSPSKKTNGVYDNNFVVTMGGTLYARGATINGTIQATDGYIGSSTDGWTIAPASITAKQGATIVLDTKGQITLGRYKIYADGTGFKLYDSQVINNTTYDTNILSINDGADGTSINRIYLGQKAGTNKIERQIEVSKNAEISGDYSGSAQDYRSGGLRNMYTTYVNYYNSNMYPDAGTGAVLLVYT